MSRRKTGDFGRWHNKWLKKNATEAARNSIDEWFNGKCEGLVANKTHKVVKADHDVTPYRTYYKYKADILTSSTSTASSGGAASATSNTSGSDKTEASSNNGPVKE